MDPDTQHAKPEDELPKQEAGETVVPTRAQAVSKFTPPSDPSKYIRTYAKDVAEVSHTQAPPPPVPVSTPQTPVPDQQAHVVHSTGVDGVSLPEFDASPVNHENDPSSPKEFEQEKVELTASDSDNIFSNPAATATADREAVLARLREKVGTGMQGMNLAPSAPSAPVQDVEPTGTIISQGPASAPSAFDSVRSMFHSATEAAEPAPYSAPTPAYTGYQQPQQYLPSIAEQIAQLAAQSPQAPVSVPTPVLPNVSSAVSEFTSTAGVPLPTPSVPSIPLATGAPDILTSAQSAFSSAPSNLPGQYGTPPFASVPTAQDLVAKAKSSWFTPKTETPASVPVEAAPVPQPEPVAPIPAPAPVTPSPIHTYSSDFSDHIDQQSSSTFSVLAAQSDAGQTPRASISTPKRTRLPLAIGIALLIVGIGVLGGAFYYAHLYSADVPVVAGVPSLITFDESVELTGTGPQLFQSLSDEAQGGSVSGNVVVAYTKTLATGESTNTPQPGGTLIHAMSLPAPDILLRNIDPSSTVGFIRAGVESRPFFLFKVNSYERTFAGMLAWERTIGSDLATLYPEYSEPVLQTATVSSTTPSFTTTDPTFVDAVVDNYDVRILRDASGRSILLYGYHGKDMLVVARDEAAFSALISRLSATKN